MSAIWYLTTKAWRRRKREVVVLALLVTLSSGVVLASLAAANRTNTAYDRFVEDTDGWDLLVNPDDGADSALQSDDIAALPQVKAAGLVSGLFTVDVDAQGLDDLENGLLVWGTDEAIFRDLARPLIREGRLPDPENPNEVFINPVAAEHYGLAPGDTFGVKAFGDDGLEMLFQTTTDEAFREVMADPSAGQTIDLQVTGVGIGPDDVAAEPAFETASVYTTPAFTRVYEPVPYFWGEAVQLVDEPGAIEAFKQGVNELAPKETVVYQSDRATHARIEHAVRPYVVALRLFAGLAAVIGLVLVTQAIGRSLEVNRPSVAAGRALGQTRAQRTAAAFWWTSLPLVVGTLLGLALAWAMSPLGPIGPVRDAEFEPGLRFEAAVLPVGFLAVLVLLLLIALLRSWRAARLRSDETNVSQSRIAATVGRLGAPVAVSTGVRFGFERSSGSSAWSARGLLVGAVTAVLLAAGLLTFGASLDHFTGTPELYAQSWDLEVTGDAEDEEVPALTTEIATILDGSSEVEAWAWLDPNEVTLDDRPVPALAFDPAGGLEPTIRSGRAPTGPDELALGVSTAAALGVGVGDSVSATTPDGETVEMNVVGEAVLPASATYPGSDKTALGTGVLMSDEALAQIAPTLDKRYAVVRLSPDGSGDTLSDELSDTTKGTTTVVPTAVPSDVLNLARLHGTPLILLALLGLAVLGGVLHALSTAFRRRRHDLAILRACGFRSGQVRSTSLWQAWTITVVALLVGIPLGVVVGRLSWVLLAGDIGILSEPRVPLTTLCALAAGTFVLTSVAGLLAGTGAARTSASALLSRE